MSNMSGLRCKVCGQLYEESPQYICEDCFGPLEVYYNYKEISSSIKEGQFNEFTKEIQNGAFPPSSLWIDQALRVGGTPLVKADRLGKLLGINELYLKDEGASYPTLSFKDRVVASAITKVTEFGFDTVACASTGNLANALAARAASKGIKCVIFVPQGSDYNKISHAMASGAIIFEVQSNYDGANRLCNEVQDALGWAVINGNLKPYYLEGVKPLAYEIMNELKDEKPTSIVAPMGGGGLLSMIWKGLCEMKNLNLLDVEPPALIGAQASGSAPIVKAWQDNSDDIMPVKPDTGIASIAIGDPPDGIYAIEAMQQSGGKGLAIPDQEANEMVKLLAKEEGIATGGAGGVALCAANELIKSDKVYNEGPVVVLLTDRGNSSDLSINATGKTKDNVIKVEAKISTFIEIWKQNHA